MSDTPYVVVDGYIHSERDGALTIITMGGEQIIVHNDTVELSTPLGAGSEKKAVRLFLKRGTTVLVQVASEVLRGIGDDTIYKYMDDGGTARKSYDDPLTSNNL
jgi:hypothetical protein